MNPLERKFRGGGGYGYFLEQHITLIGVIQNFFKINYYSEENV